MLIFDFRILIFEHYFQISELKFQNSNFRFQISNLNLNQEELKDRTKKFGLRIIKLVDFLPNRKIGDVIGRQILRSATGVGANYRAACRARSKAEFISKLNIVLEETDETLYWLELIEESGLINKEKLADIIRENKELVAIFIATLKSLKNKWQGRKIWNLKLEIWN